MVNIWPAVKGNVLHRCVLAAPGKWLYATKARALDEIRYEDVGPEPVLVSEARWVARTLGGALAAHDDDTVRGLIDAGGPYWSDLYSNFLALSEDGQAKVCADLETPACAAAWALLAMSRENRWVQLRSEVEDPFVPLLREKRDVANLRRYPWVCTGLLVERKPSIPGATALVIDLKFGSSAPSVEAMAGHTAKAAEVYGRAVANRLGRSVDARILHTTFDGVTTWGESLEVLPDDDREAV